MTFIDKIMNFADEHDMFPSAGIAIACVSGGADSMCLLEALLEISGKRGFGVCAAHYNHKLRGEGSDRDEAFVRDCCAGRGVPFYSGSGDVRAYAAAHGKGVEEAARDLRYGFFERVAAETGAVRIATAHTADDNLETMVFNLARGTGTAGFGGIPPKRRLAGGNPREAGPGDRCSTVSGDLNGCAQSDAFLIRPMLSVTRYDVMDFLGERGVSFVEDPTNALEHFTRNKIRHRIIPVLREINPRATEAASAAAALARADEDHLSALADEFIEGQKADSLLAQPNGSDFALFGKEGGSQSRVFWNLFSLDAGELAGLPAAVSSRVIRKLCPGSLSHIHVEEVLELCRRGSASKMLSLPGGTVSREYGRIVFGIGLAPAAEGFEPIQIPLGGAQYSAVIPGLGLKVTCASVEHYGDEYGKINKSFSSFLFKTLDICGRMTVRSRREGDSFRLLGRGHTKTLKKLFIERRVPAMVRPLIPVVSDDEGVLAVYGLGIGDRAVPAAGDHAVSVCFEDIDREE